MLIQPAYATKRDFIVCEKNQSDYIIKETQIRIKQLEAEQKIYPKCEELTNEIAYEKTILEDMEFAKSIITTNNAANVRSGVANVVFANFTEEEIYKKIIEDYSKIKDNPITTTYGYYNVDIDRQKTVNLAKSCEGKIVYEWDSKPLSKEWDIKWDTKEKGLDCSGFVSWIYWNVNGEFDEKFNSTYSITNSCTKITEEELQPGDLGTILDEGTYYTINNIKYTTYAEALLEVEHNENVTLEMIKTHSNHVGIYLGIDENGEKLWCHCSGTANTVVIDHFNFTHYYAS